MKIYNYFFIFILMMSFMSFALAESYEEGYSVNLEVDSSLQIESLKYEPYPVNPDEYFTLWFLVKKTGSNNKGATFELNAEYPFSLDSNEDPVRTFSGLMGESVLLKYKVRVDKDAVEGENQIELKYKLDGATVWTSKEFDIEVSDAQTSFDGVIQDVEDGTISLALANTGKNVASSVIVKIPEQQSFESSGTAGQMVGNLDNGDYTIVTFDLNQLERGEQTLIFQIDYTDGIDERRTVYLNIPVNLQTGVSSIATGEMPTEFSQRNGNSGGISWWIYAIIIIVLIVLFKFKDKIIESIKKQRE